MNGLKEKIKPIPLSSSKVVIISIYFLVVALGGIFTYTFFGTRRGYDIFSNLDVFYRNMYMGGYFLLALLIPLVISVFTSYFRAVVSGFFIGMIIFVTPLFFIKISGGGPGAGFAPLGAIFGTMAFFVLTCGVVFVLGNFFRFVLNIRSRWMPILIFVLILVFVYGIIGYKLVEQTSFTHTNCEVVGQGNRLACHLKMADKNPSVISCNILTLPLSRATCYGAYAYKEKDGLVCNEFTKKPDIRNGRDVGKDAYEQCARVYKNLSAKDLQ